LQAIDLLARFGHGLAQQPPAFLSTGLLLDDVDQQRPRQLWLARLQVGSRAL
jgi:hypothetical protein